MSSFPSITVPNDVLLGEVSSLLDKGKDVVLLAKGSSMLPFIRDGRDSVRLRKHGQVRIGDIVLARVSTGNWVLHRVFSIDGGRIILMGDGNLKGTESCTPDDIAGTVEAIIDEKGRERTPSDGRVWKSLLPARRYILGIYRRLI